MTFFTVPIFLLVATCLAMQGLAAWPGPTDSVCLDLGRIFDGVLFTQNDTEYSVLREENWSQTSWRTPSCIFRPSSAQELQEALPLLTESNTKFAVRSGGHSPSPQAANIDGGVLIDLSSLNHVDYDEYSSVAAVGSGARWGEVYTQLDAYNVTVVGGRVSDVGVGGLTLGSGLSYLSDLHGMVCDNVVNFEIVIANGSIINANQTHNTDLFWALKGGSNNFGIVTTFTLSTYPIGDVWAGIKFYTLDDLPALFDAMFEYQITPQKDLNANLMLQGYISNATIGIALSLVYLEPIESPAAFAPFYHINTTADTTTVTSLSSFIAGQGPPSFPPRVDWRTTAFEPNKAHYDSLTSLLVNSSAMEQIKSVTAGTVVFGLQPISSSVVQAGHARGGNALGLNSVNQTWFVIDSGWWDEGDDDVVHDATRSIVKSIEDSSMKEGIHVDYLFMNDASWDQPVISSYGADSVSRMRDVQGQYDPDRVFQRLMPGGFKLP